MSTTPDRVRLRHKDTNAEHDFHPRTVERWKAAGWEPIADDEQSDDASQIDTADALDIAAPTPPDDVEPTPRSRAKSSTASSSTRA